MMLAYEHMDAPCQVLSAQADSLPSILEPTVNLAVWQRELPSPLQSFISTMLAAGTHVSQSVTLEPRENGPQHLSGLLPECAAMPGYDDFIDDLTLLFEMFVCLFEVRRAGIRLRSLDAAMCPRWHVDQVPVRLITTYSGPGSQWLGEGRMPRDAIGSPRSDDWSAVQPSGTLKAGDVALFKGERWHGNEGRGIVHRSPVPGQGERRMVVTLDWLR
ncbi:DUF1826 domain-containing protein [Pseudomonas saliphila]|uniref:DUF1826 domain-containing protein n=1 Tax=Pseudomonas saliphila TaxID=2586906 RepID=UPI00123A3317|nr:DUF1826 domain-containing protein [Pseudomonas saliphila]